MFLLGLVMDLRPLVSILSDGGFHSGQALSVELGVTRTLVVRQVEQLREMGIEVHSVTGKGYRLPYVLELIAKDDVLAQLGDSAPYWKTGFDVLFSTGSTNADAMAKGQAGASRYLCIAEHQSAGKGRRGKAWVSPLGANISLSMLWTFEAGMAALEGLSLVVAILVVDALKSCGYKGMGVKWPNDILLDASKLAGILIEINGDAAGPCKVVIGIGINVRMPASSAESIDQRYTDLASNSETIPDRNRIAASLVLSLQAGLAEFASSGFEAFQQRWNAVDVYKGRVVDIVSGTNRQRGVSLGVNGSAALLLQTDSGVLRISGGEITPSLRPVFDEGGVNA